MAAAVSSAAVDCDSANLWIYAVEDSSATFESMHDRGLEASLDDKIRAALLKNQTGAGYAKHKTLMDMIRAKAKTMRRVDGSTIRGRQMLIVIKNFYAVVADEKVSFDITALVDYKWQGDDVLPEWKIHWDWMVNNQEVPLAHKQIERIFYLKLRQSSILKNYVDYYERLAKSDSERSYTYLSEKTDKLIEENRQTRNQQSLQAGKDFVKPPRNAAPATAADQSGGGGANQPSRRERKGAGKGKDGGKGGDKDGSKGGKGGKAGGKGAGGAPSGDAGKTYTDTEGRPMRCVWHWFAKCKNRPLKNGAKFQFGEHCSVPREDEKLRKEFTRMEGLHGTWMPGLFKYASLAAPAAQLAQGDKGATPPASPRK